MSNPTDCPTCGARPAEPCKRDGNPRMDHYSRFVDDDPEHQGVHIERLQRIHDAVEHLRELKPGWDSYDAKAIDPRAVEVAREIVHTRRDAWAVVPLPDGGVMLARPGEGCRIEIEIRIEDGKESRA